MNRNVCPSSGPTQKDLFGLVLAVKNKKLGVFILFFKLDNSGGQLLRTFFKMLKGTHLPKQPAQREKLPEAVKLVGMYVHIGLRIHN